MVTMSLTSKKSFMAAHGFFKQLQKVFCARSQSIVQKKGHLDLPAAEGQAEHTLRCSRISDTLGHIAPRDFTNIRVLWQTPNMFDGHDYSMWNVGHSGLCDTAKVTVLCLNLKDGSDKIQCGCKVVHIKKCNEENLTCHRYIWSTVIDGHAAS